MIFLSYIKLTPKLEWINENMQSALKLRSNFFQHFRHYGLSICLACFYASKKKRDRGIDG